jgi:tripartite-type tricarboxylate transporter receptor subunit TctC
VNRRNLLSFTAAAGLLPFGTWAAEWPDRPIRLVIPFAAGTTTDIIGRILGNYLSKALGQPVVADNRSGGGGTVGAMAAAQAVPDGCTLFLGTSGTQATNPAMMANLGYDPLHDLAPIACVAKTPVILGVRPQLGVADLAGFIGLAKRRNLSIGSAGTGTTGHLTQAQLDLAAGIQTTHVSYRDAGRGIADLLNGTLDAFIYHPLGFLPHIQSGAVKPLAVTGERRHFLFPDLPTMVEAGAPGVVVEGWWALYAPARTPMPIITRLNALVNEALRDEATLAELRRQGLEAIGGPPEALTALNQIELEKQRRLVRAANITPE